jgi:hypothetical protein
VLVVDVEHAAEGVLVGPALPSVREGATSVHAKRLCIGSLLSRGTCPGSPKHAPTAARRETLAQNSRRLQRRRVQRRGSCNVRGRAAGGDIGSSLDASRGLAPSSQSEGC